MKIILKDRIKPIIQIILVPTFNAKNAVFLLSLEGGNKNFKNFLFVEKFAISSLSISIYKSFMNVSLSTPLPASVSLQPMFMNSNFSFYRKWPSLSDIIFLFKENIST